MEGFLASIGVAFILFALLVIAFSAREARSRQTGVTRGPHETPMFPDQLLPAHYDFELSEELRAKAEEATSLSPEEALKVFEKIAADATSAVMVLNIAKIWLDQNEANKRSDQLPEKKRQEAKSYISEMIKKARVWIADAPNRYPQNINDDYVQKLEDKLQLL